MQHMHSVLQQPSAPPFHGQVSVDVLDSSPQAPRSQNRSLGVEPYTNCTQLRPPGSTAYVVIYDLFEPYNKLEKRRRMHLRVFEQILQTNTTADLILILPMLNDPKARILLQGVDYIFIMSPFQISELALVCCPCCAVLCCAIYSVSRFGTTGIDHSCIFDGSS